MKILFIWFALSSALNVADSANILAFFNVPSISHQYVFRAIAKELSLRGHQVTFATPNPINDPTLSNLTEIDISCAYRAIERINIPKTFNRASTSLISMILSAPEFMRNTTEPQMEVKEVKELLKKPKNSFDLILVEAISLPFYGLKHVFDAPLIGISSLGLNYMHHELHGNPNHPIIYPEFMSGHFHPLKTIWEKFDSIYVHLLFHFSTHYYLMQDYDQFARKYFGNDMPYLYDLIKETSMTIANVNPVFSENRPLAPNVLNVWNIHLNRKEEPLSKDLKKILDESKNGVVYFSLGTNVRFGHLESNFKQTMLEALGELPYTVLCKWESEDFPNKPKNVVLRKFFPQQSILSHPNIKLFVTQGGLQSSEEAISNGVPLVVIPFLGDQPMNARILSGHGMAETILPKDLSKEILRDTILKVAKDEKYRLRAQELRSIFLDQPESGVDKIIWWCEYVIRHKGAKHLRSPSADIPLYEYFMLDVFAVIFAFLFIGYKVFRFVVCKFISFCKGTEKSKTKQKTN